MKKVLSLITLIFIMIANQTFAITYRDEIKLNLNPDVENTADNINGARLIEKYLKKLKTEIDNFNEKYDIKSDVEISQFLKKIETMTFMLRKIQTISIEKNVAEDVIRSIIDELKTLNPKIKSYLKNKKRIIGIETANTKNNYVIFSQKLSKSLTKFIDEINSKTNNKNKIEIEKHLTILKSQNKKLINFKDLSFDNSTEIKSTFIKILKNIQIEFIEIKKLIKK